MANAPALTLSRPTGSWARFGSNRIGITGAAALAVLIVAAAAAPWLTPYDPLAQDSLSFEPLSLGHPLGTDELGRDILSRILFGFRLSLLTGRESHGRARRTRKKPFLSSGSKVDDWRQAYTPAQPRRGLR